MANNDYVKIAYLYKAHGLKGELKISFEAFFLGYEQKLQHFFVKQKGEYIPYFVESVTSVVAKYQLIKIEDIIAKEQAARIAKKEVYLTEKLLIEWGVPYKEDEEYDLEYLIGFTLQAQGGDFKATIEEVLYFPQQELAKVIYKEQEILIPLHDDYLVQIDEDKKLIELDLPDGLLEVYLEE